MSRKCLEKRIFNILVFIFKRLLWKSPCLNILSNQHFFARFCYNIKFESCATLLLERTDASEHNWFNRVKNHEILLQAVTLVSCVNSSVSLSLVLWPDQYDLIRWASSLYLPVCSNTWMVWHVFMTSERLTVKISLWYYRI